jgi:two-component system response regulator RegX3
MRAMPGPVARTPVIMLTARDGEIDRVLGLELGADDYLCKPFSMRELLARVRANIRRTSMVDPLVESVELLARGPVRMDLARHEVMVRGERRMLPPKEFLLLQVMLQAQGRLRTRGSLIDEVWGPHYIGDTKTLDVHIKRLRRKIEVDPHRPEHLLTVRGFGYRFVAEVDPEVAVGS